MDEIIIRCAKRFNEIPFAHRAPNHDGHCRFIHGHNWSVEVVFESAADDANGFVVDFGKMDFIKKYLDEFDHALVLAVDDPAAAALQAAEKSLGFKFMKLILVESTSSEGLAKHFYEKFSAAISKSQDLSARGARVNRVRVFEDGKNSAVYLER